MAVLGIDTSNYTTSAALILDKSVKSEKKLLPVKEGELGLRQSDAVFYHTVQLPEVLECLFEDAEHKKIEAVGVSVRPRDVEGSYMPCFLTGKSAAKAAALSCGAEYFEFSHQAGHIAAALFSAERLDLIEKRFIAFHVSGGTTEALLVTPSDNYVFNCKIVARSLDLKAGQAIDRTGKLLGLKFPSGAEIDRLACESVRKFKIKPAMKGADCCLSGIQNKCKDMLYAGEQREDIANYCISYICAAVDAMTEKVIEEYGELPLIYAGGVMCNSQIKRYITEKYGACFASPQFSSDNAAGIAVLADMKMNKKG